MSHPPAGLVAALPDHYRIERELGQGGMATVYLAHDAKHGREVAIKVLRPELAALLGRERFLAEIRLTARLDHPHILTLIDSGEGAGFVWYVLPYIRGESLRQKLDRERQLGLADALAIATDVAGALDYAHRRGVIHRDVKPENILLHEGEAMLTDFGIALAVREAGGERLTETGLSLGTPHYMSPEQATAERQLDARSDVYSLGAVLYEMLAGEPPFTGATGQAVIAKLMTERPTALRTLRETVPAGVDQAVARALAKVPADRFPDAASLAAALVAPAREESPHRARLARLAVRVMIGLSLVVLAAWGGRLLTSTTGSTKARDPELVALYQRARHEYSRRTVAGAAEAIRGFGEVVQRDPSYAPAWVGLAKTYVRAYIRNHAIPGLPRDTLIPLALAAVDRAQALDSLNAEGWVARAEVTRCVDPTDRKAMLRAADRALALDSLSGEGWHVRALGLAEQGDLSAAIEGWRRAVAAAPDYIEAVAFLAWGHYWRHQFDSAEVWADSAVVLDPTYLLGRTTLGEVLLETGQFDRAAASFEAAGRLSGDSSDIEAVNALSERALAEARAGRRRDAVALTAAAERGARRFNPTPLHTAVQLAKAYVGLGDPGRAVGWLDRFSPRGDLHFQLHIRCDLPFAAMAGDPRFQALLTPLESKVGNGC